MYTVYKRQQICRGLGPRSVILQLTSPTIRALHHFPVNGLDFSRQRQVHRLTSGGKSFMYRPNQQDKLFPRISQYYRIRVHIALEDGLQ